MQQKNVSLTQRDGLREQETDKVDPNEVYEDADPIKSVLVKLMRSFLLLSMDSLTSPRYFPNNLLLMRVKLNCCPIALTTDFT